MIFPSPGSGEGFFYSICLPRNAAAVCVMEERDDWHPEEEEQPEPTHSEENRGNITQIPMIIPGNELLQLPLQPNHPINAPFQLSQLPFNGGSK